MKSCVPWLRHASGWLWSSLQTWKGSFFLRYCNAKHELKPRALHNKPTANEHSKVIFTPIILSQKYFLQGPNCTHIQALIVLSRTYPASDKNKNTIKLSCSACYVSCVGQAALNASVLGLSQVTHWTLPPLGTQASPQCSSYWHCCSGVRAR